MNKLFNYLAILSIMTVISSCNNQQNIGESIPALEPSNMDLTVVPGNDFYQYANGVWINNHPIPEEFSRYGAFAYAIVAFKFVFNLILMF